MAVSYTKEYKKTKKLEYKIAVRQGIFITDYVKTKYDQIYMEAADLYNRINNKYPCKPNLMKTTEFRTWKNKIATEKQQSTISVPRQRDRYLKPTEYPNITSAEDNNTSPRPTNLSTGNRQFVPRNSPHQPVQHKHHADKRGRYDRNTMRGRRAISRRQTGTIR